MGDTLGPVSPLASMTRMHGPRSLRVLGTSMAQKSALIVWCAIRGSACSLLVCWFRSNCTSVLSAVGVLRDLAFDLQSSMRQPAAYANKNSVNRWALQDDLAALDLHAGL